MMASSKAGKIERWDPLKRSFLSWESDKALILASGSSNCTRPCPLDFQFLCSEKISMAKIVPLPSADSRKVKSSCATALCGMFVTFTVSVCLSLSMIILMVVVVVVVEGGRERVRVYWGLYEVL